MTENQFRVLNLFNIHILQQLIYDIGCVLYAIITSGNYTRLLHLDTTPQCYMTHSYYTRLLNTPMPLTFVLLVHDPSLDYVNGRRGQRRDKTSAHGRHDMQDCPFSKYTGINQRVLCVVVTGYLNNHWGTSLNRKWGVINGGWD